MFGSSEFKKQVFAAIKQLEGQVSDLKKTEVELRSNQTRLSQLVKNLGRKLAVRLPISLESLEKGLSYDLIFPDEVQAWRKAASQGLVVDIRPTHEYSRGTIEGSLSIPLDQLSMKLENLPKETPLLVVCENGIKSVSACELLNQKGYMFTYVLKGGMALLRDLQEANANPASASEDHSRIAQA